MGNRWLTPRLILEDNLTGVSPLGHGWQTASCQRLFFGSGPRTVNDTARGQCQKCLPADPGASQPNPLGI